MTDEHRLRLLRLVNWAVWVIAGIMTFFLIITAYWLLEDYKLAYIQEPIKILNDNKEVKVGEVIRMELNVKKTDQYPITNNSHRIECDSGNLITLTNVQNVSLPVGEYSVISDRYVMPPKANDGDVCRFYFQTTFKINPFVDVTDDWVSENFIVKE